jgi:predicted methyltransferase
MGPLLTSSIAAQLRRARVAGSASVECSLDLDLSSTIAHISEKTWTWRGIAYPYADACKERTIYYWNAVAFVPAARYTHSLIKLVPTVWGAPTFEIDGIKMLPSSKVSPYLDARSKVELVLPRGAVVLDTCGGLGYFAAWCSQGHAAKILYWTWHMTM